MDFRIPLIALTVIVAAIFVAIGVVALLSTYLLEVRKELAKGKAFHAIQMDEAELSRLPVPVRRYFSRCGFTGRASMKNARFTWESFEMRMARDKGWMPVRVRQVNSVIEPARFVYLRARMAGIVPITGRDKYQEGRGNMIIRIGGWFTVADSRSPRMDQSGLVTFLAEALLMPSAALQPYMRWEELGEDSARATLAYGGTRASGVFRFDGNGEFISFESSDRWQDGHDEGPIPWRIEAAEYRDMGGFRLPTEFRAAWREQAGDFEYFRGRLARIEFNVEEP